MSELHWPDYVSAAAALVSVLLTIRTLIESSKKSAQDAQQYAEKLEAQEYHHRQNLRHAAQRQEKEMKVSHYITITQRVFDVDRIFIEYPELRAFFYDSALVGEDANIERITSVAEYVLDFYSTLQEHERLLRESDLPSWDEWVVFIRDGFKYSPYLCVYFSKNTDLYEPGLKKIYDEVAIDMTDILHQQTVLLGSHAAEIN